MLTVAIDPGHGGHNHGTRVGGRLEKELTLEMAEELASTLACAPVNAVLLRDADEPVELATRGALAAKYGADLVVSIHINAWAPQPGKRGSMAFYWPGNETGRQVAQAVQDSMPKALQGPGHAHSVYAATADRWPNVRSVLRHHGATSVLLECGFATNERDREYLLSRWGRSGVVCAARSGVVRFGELMEVGR